MHCVRVTTGYQSYTKNTSYLEDFVHSNLTRNAFLYKVKDKNQNLDDNATSSSSIFIREAFFSADHQTTYYTVYTSVCLVIVSIAYFVSLMH